MATKFFNPALLILVVYACLGCKKSSDSNMPELEYAFEAFDPNAQFGLAYNNEFGVQISGIYKSGWKNKFKITNKPFTAYLQASPFTGFTTTTVTLRIFVNNRLVKEAVGTLSTTSFTIQSVQYVVE